MQDDQPKATEWVLDSGCTNHMTGDKNLLMDAPLSPSHLKHIIFADKGKSQVLGLGKVAITKDRHMDKVMLVKSLGYDKSPTYLEFLIAPCYIIYCFGCLWALLYTLISFLGLTY